MKVDKTGERISPEADHNSYIEQLSIYNFFTNEIKKYKHDDFKLLDCASGTGYGLDYLISNTNLQPQNCIGIDISEEAVEFSRNRYEKLNYEVGDLLGLKNKDLDIFTCNQTLEHFYEEDQFRVIKSIYNSLKNGGTAMIGVPNKPIYQKFDPNNKFHLNELDLEALKKIIKSCDWSISHFYFQQIPEYQESKIRKNKFVKFILSALPVFLLYILSNLLNPKIKIENLKIFDEKDGDINKAKYLIVVCRK